MSKFSKQYKDSQNKSKWISNKIDKLVSEGKPKKQAIAISNAMWNSRKAAGGSFVTDNPLYNNPILPMGPMTPQQTKDQEQFDFLNSYQGGVQPTNTESQKEEVEEDIFKRTPIQPASTLTRQGTTSDTKVNYGEGLNKNGYRNIDSYEGYDMNPQVGRTPTKVNTKYTEENQRQEEQGQNLPPVNPYAGPDLNSSFYNLGQSIEQGNTLGIVGNAGKAVLVSARNFMSGMGQQRRAQDAMDERREELRDEASGVNRVRYVENGGEYESYGYGGKKKMYKEDGGEVDQDRILTGEVLTGVSGNNQLVEPNTEIEDGEYVLSRDGQSIKVEGKKHSQGGEDVELQDGDKVISDNLKLKGENAKTVRDKFDIKAKAKDTYATVVDKVYKKIGLEKLIKEEEEVISRIRKQEEKLGEGATKDLNLQLLYKKKEKIGEEKQKLEEQRQNVLNEVYNMQESSKPKEETEEGKMQDGGPFQPLNPEKRGVYTETRETLKKYGTPQDITSVEDARSAIRNLRFIEALNRKNIDEFNNAKVSDLDQKFIGDPENYRKEIESTMRNDQAMLNSYYKRMDELMREQRNEQFEDGGEKGEEDFTAENEKVYLGLSEALKEVPEGQSLKDVDGFEVYGDVTKEDLLETIKRNTWYDFTGFKPTKENTLKFQKEYNKRVKDGAKLKEDGKFGEQTASAYLPWVTEMEEEIDDSELESQTQDSNATQTNIQEGEQTEEGESQGKFQGFQGRPDQSVLPPSGVDAQFKANRRYDRIDPNLMSPDQIIQENERRAAAAIKSAQQLPDSQRAAVIAQITAQTQKANQQAISQVDTSNNQILNNAQAQNAQIQGREQDAAVQDALSFEKRQQTAESLTEENMRGFLDYNRKVNLQNFNDTRRQNTINRAFENFDLDAQGNIINKGSYDADYQNYLMGLQKGKKLANAPQKTTKKKS